MKQAKSSKFFTLRISIPGTEPEVWREIVVHDSLVFHALHDIIQVTMGWTDSHPYDFQFGRDVRISSPDFDNPFGMVEEHDASRVKLSQFIERARQKFIYEYDFGDCWKHEIKVTKVTPVDGKPLFKATILDGANAGPPDDCGGIWGYVNLKEALADPKHESHEDIKEWLGEDFDPTFFDIKAVRKILDGKGAQEFWKAVGF